MVTPSLTLAEQYGISDEELAFLRARRLLTPRQRAMIDCGVFGVVADRKQESDQAAHERRLTLRLVATPSKEESHG